MLIAEDERLMYTNTVNCLFISSCTYASFVITYDIGLISFANETKVFDEVITKHASAYKLIMYLSLQCAVALLHMK